MGRGSLYKQLRGSGEFVGREGEGERETKRGRGRERRRGRARGYCGHFTLMFGFKGCESYHFFVTSTKR